MSTFFAHFWVGATAKQQQTHPKVMTKNVQKMFNCLEVLSEKIHTLVTKLCQNQVEYFFQILWPSHNEWSSTHFDSVWISWIWFFIENSISLFIISKTLVIFGVFVCYINSQTFKTIQPYSSLHLLRQYSLGYVRNEWRYEDELCSRLLQCYKPQVL